MPRVKIQIYGSLAAQHGLDSATVEAATAGEALEQVAGGSLVHRPASDAGSPSLLVVLRGRNLPRPAWSTTQVEEGDVIHVFPPVCGGALAVPQGGTDARDSR